MNVLVQYVVLDPILMQKTLQSSANRKQPKQNKQTNMLCCKESHIFWKEVNLPEQVVLLFCKQMDMSHKLYGMKGLSKNPLALGGVQLLNRLLNSWSTLFLKELNSRLLQESIQQYIPGIGMALHYMVSSVPSNYSFYDSMIQFQNSMF